MDINKAFRLEILSRMKDVSDFMKKSDWGRTWAYEMNKSDKFRFTLETAHSAANGVDASFLDVYRAAIMRIRSSKFHVSQVWESPRKARYRVLSISDDNKVTLQNIDNMFKTKRKADDVVGWVLISDKLESNKES